MRIGTRTNKVRTGPQEPSLGRLQIQAVKIATLTEVVWFGSKVMDDSKVLDLVRNMLVAMDWPDGWWRRRVNTTLGEWIKFLRIEFEEERMRMERREMTAEEASDGAG